MFAVAIAGRKFLNFLIAMVEITSGDVYIKHVDRLPPLSIMGDKSVSPHRPVASFFAPGEDSVSVQTRM